MEKIERKNIVQNVFKQQKRRIKTRTETPECEN